MADPSLLFSFFTSISPFYGYLGLLIGSLFTMYYAFFVLKEDEKDWEDYGVKVPADMPNGFVGQDFRTEITKLLNQHGDTLGFKAGKRLMLLTTNFDLLRNILIKDFNSFVDRTETIPTSSPLKKSVFFSKGTQWRRQRSIISPAFTTGKLKYIFKSVDASAKALANYFEVFAKDGTLAPIKDSCARFTCEVIAKTAFGIDANYIGQEDSQFYDYAKNIITFKERGKWVELVHWLSRQIPFFTTLCIHVFKIQFYDPVSIEGTRYFRAILKHVIQEKQKQNSEVQKSKLDMLDLLLKSNDEASKGQLRTADVNEDEEATHGIAMKELTDEEIVGQSMLLIFAGMETTATTLQMCLYELAVHPDIQERVYEEIQKVVKEDRPSPEELTTLSYMDQVLNETLRKYQPVPLVNREAKETLTYNGITIPKGAGVLIPYYHMLKDPKIFPDPEKFDPERFSPAEKAKRDAMAFVSFGHGPRLCLGMRLAYMELRVALVHVLRKVKVVINDKTEPRKGTPTVQFTTFNLLTPVKPIKLAFELRDRN